MNIVLTRIDNRLLHGQVVVTWSNHCNANLIVVPNDAIAADEMKKNIMSLAVPAGVGVRFYSVDQAIQTLPKASPRQLIMLVCETPQDVLRLVEGGIPIKEVNVGNMHFAEGKKQICFTIAVSEEDVETFKKLEARGVHCVMQRVPTEPASDILTVLQSEV